MKEWHPPLRANISVAGRRNNLLSLGMDDFYFVLPFFLFMFYSVYRVCLCFLFVCTNSSSCFVSFRHVCLHFGWFLSKLMRRFTGFVRLLQQPILLWIFCFRGLVSFLCSLSLSFSHIFTLAAATAVDRTDRVDSSHTPPGRRKKEVEKSSVVRHSALKGAVGGGGLAHGC